MRGLTYFQILLINYYNHNLLNEWFYEENSVIKTFLTTITHAFELISIINKKVLKMTKDYKIKKRAPVITGILFIYLKYSHKKAL
jgi:hypothetical protein